MMQRRAFAATLAGTALLPGAIHAQPLRRRRIGVLLPDDKQWEPRAFLDALARLGYVRGATINIDVQSAEGVLDRLPAMAERMAASDAEVIVAANTPSARAAMTATRSKPIVVGVVADPVGMGLVGRLARPDGNATGISNMASELAPKRVQLFREAVPSMRRIVAQYHPDDPVSQPQMRLLDQPALRYGIGLDYDGVRTFADVEESLRRAAARPGTGILRLAGQGLSLEGALAELGRRYRVPTMVLSAAGVRAGGLLSYFADSEALWHRVAYLTHRVLSGEKPGTLPFEQPTRFTLAVNLATSRELGLVIPPATLARADEVIE